MMSQIMRPYSWQGLDTSTRYEDAEGQIKYRRDSRYRVFVWGHNQHNIPVCWRIDDYFPYLFLRFETITNKDVKQHAEVLIKTLETQLMEYVKHLAKGAGSQKWKPLLYTDGIIRGYSVEERTPFFYRKTRQDTLIKVYFSLEKGMELCAQFAENRKLDIGEEPLEMKAFHKNGGDRISTILKLLDSKGLKYCDWLIAKVEKVRHGYKQTKLNEEYIVQLNTLEALPDEQQIELGFPQPSLLSFDIETYSEVHTKFPKASNIKDEVYAIGCRHIVYPEIKSTHEQAHVVNYILLVWDEEEKGQVDLKPEKYGQSIAICSKTEPEMISTFFELIMQLDPSFVVSYNGINYDWDYIEKRCSIWGMRFPNLSRILYWDRPQLIPFKCQLSAKFYEGKYPNYPGRIDVDMLFIIREQNIKSGNYKLATIAALLLGETKVDLPYAEQFRKRSTGLLEDMNDIINYIQQDIHLPVGLYKKLVGNIYLHEFGSVMSVNPFSLYTTGQSERAISNIYRVVMTDGKYADERTIPKSEGYIGGKVFPPIPGLYDDVFTFDFASLYPSEMKDKNICFTTLVDEKNDKHKIKDEDCNIVEADVPVMGKGKQKDVVIRTYPVRYRYIKANIYLGILPRIVTNLNALRSVYKRKMGDADKVVKELTVKIDLKKLRLKLERAIETSAADVDEIRDEFEKAQKVNKTTYSSEQFESIDLERLRLELEEAKKTHKIWDIRQQAVKVAANSMYGFTGMKGGKYSFIEGGMSTTLSGREAIDKAMHIATEEFGAKLIYGDTDSIMVQFDPSVVNRLNYPQELKKIQNYISDQFSEHVNIVFENYFYRFLVITKKRYAGIKKNPEKPHEMPTREEIIAKSLLYVKGLISVRGNSCGIVYKIFNEILLDILLGYSLADILKVLDDFTLRICRRDFPISDYILSQRIGTKYKDGGTSTMPIYVDLLRQHGRVHKGGEEVEYIFRKLIGEPRYVGQRMWPPDWFDEDGSVLDVQWYLNRQIANHIEQLISTAYSDDDVPWTVKERIYNHYRNRNTPPINRIKDPKWFVQGIYSGNAVRIHKDWQAVNEEIRVNRIAMEEMNGGPMYEHTDETTAAAMIERYGQ